MRLKKTIKLIDQIITMLEELKLLRCQHCGYVFPESELVFTEGDCLSCGAIDEQLIPVGRDERDKLKEILKEWGYSHEPPLLEE